MSDASLFGSRLLGSPDDAFGYRLLRSTLLLLGFIVTANLIGIGIVIALSMVVLPGPAISISGLSLIKISSVAAYIVFAIVFGIAGGGIAVFRTLPWLLEDRTPTEQEARSVFVLPQRLTVVQAVLWGTAAVIFPLILGFGQPAMMLKVAFACVLTSVLVCANSYLLIEFAVRPWAAVALQNHPALGRQQLTGAVGRTMLYWGLGNGLPILGLTLATVYAAVSDTSKAQLVLCVLVLDGVALVVGATLTYLAIRAVIAPIQGVQAAMKQIEQGDLDAHILVYDGTELGELQSGFNLMAQGLREQERIRDLFGKHVGQDVASAALSHRPELGGEERDVAVIFVDIVGSTPLAASRPASEVVAVLNRFFSVVVDEVDQHGGFVNKFQGDAALAIFGAPVDLADPAGDALGAARSIRDRLAVEVPECSIGIGVSFGPAVAGNVGSDVRFEYTVIGDPVNEAARLSELAKTSPMRLLASDRAFAATVSAETGHWALGDTVTVRGRSQPTQLATTVV